jgi:hypothetical protein
VSSALSLTARTAPTPSPNGSAYLSMLLLLQSIGHALCMLPTPSDSSSTARLPQRSIGNALFDALVAGANVNLTRAASATPDSYAIHADDADGLEGRWAGRSWSKFQLKPPVAGASSSRASSAYGRSTSRTHTHDITGSSRSPSRPASGMSAASWRSGASSGASSSASSSHSRTNLSASAAFRSPILSTAIDPARAAVLKHTVLAHGGSPDPVAIAASFATLESLCVNPSLADLHSALRRCTKELSLGVYCHREWFGFNVGAANAVPFFEILKDAGQQLAQARASLGAERNINAQLMAQVT